MKEILFTEHKYQFCWHANIIKVNLQAESCATCSNYSPMVFGQQLTLLFCLKIRATRQIGCASTLFFIAVKSAVKKCSRKNVEKGFEVSNAESTQGNCKQKQSLWQKGAIQNQWMNYWSAPSPHAAHWSTHTHTPTHTLIHLHTPLVTYWSWSLLCAGQLTHTEVLRLCLLLQSFMWTQTLNWADVFSLRLIQCSWLFHESLKHFNPPLPQLNPQHTLIQRRGWNSAIHTIAAFKVRQTVHDEDASFFFWWEQ